MDDNVSWSFFSFLFRKRKIRIWVDEQIILIICTQNNTRTHEAERDDKKKKQKKSTKNCSCKRFATIYKSLRGLREFWLRREKKTRKKLSLIYLTISNAELSRSMPAICHSPTRKRKKNFRQKNKILFSGHLSFSCAAEVKFFSESKMKMEKAYHIISFVSSFFSLVLHAKAGSFCLGMPQTQCRRIFSFLLFRQTTTST